MSESVTATLFAKLKRSQRLPSPPGTALRVLELCRSDDTDVRKITQALIADPALSTRLLRYANSAALGASHEVTSVRDAVLHLGLRSVKLAALGFTLPTNVEAACRGFSLQYFWTESIVTALLARRFAAQLGADREEAFTAGLLAGVGQLALAQGLPEEYGAVLSAAGDHTPDALLEIERGLLGTDHLAFAAELLTQWGMPAALVQPIAGYRDPTSIDAAIRPLAQVLRVARTLSVLFLQEGEFPPRLKQAARALVEQTLKLSEAQWKQVAEEIRANCTELGEVFNVAIDPATVFDLYAEAQEEATRVGMVAQLEKSRALEENEDLLRRATTDALTGIANRAKFDERLRELVLGLGRQHGDFALLLLDIDNFKKFNDTYGHAVGDVVLREVAQAVHRSLREVDFVARYGGEEFAILAPRTDTRGACIVAARTRKCVESLTVAAEGRQLRVTVSIGLVVSSDYATPPTGEQLQHDVDQQLYRAKHAGRNTWSYRNRTAKEVAAPAPQADVATHAR